MDDTSIQTENFRFTCIECQNTNSTEEGLSTGIVIECEYCGIEYDIKEVKEDGQYVLQILEEEK